MDRYPSFEQLVPAVPEACETPGLFQFWLNKFFFFFFKLRPFELSLRPPIKHNRINTGNKEKGRANMSISGNFPDQLLRQFLLNSLLLDTLVLPLYPINQHVLREQYFSQRRLWPTSESWNKFNGSWPALFFSLMKKKRIEGIENISVHYTLQGWVLFYNTFLSVVCMCAVYVKYISSCGVQSNQFENHHYRTFCGKHCRLPTQ